MTKIIIGETIAWSQKFKVYQVEDIHVINKYVGRTIIWAYQSAPEVIKENEIIDVGLMEGSNDHYLIKVKPNDQDQAAHEVARKELKEKLDMDLDEQKKPWLMWATYNNSIYSTFEIK